MKKNTTVDEIFSSLISFQLSEKEEEIILNSMSKMKYMELPSMKRREFLKRKFALLLDIHFFGNGGK